MRACYTSRLCFVVYVKFRKQEPLLKWNTFLVKQKPEVSLINENKFSRQPVFESLENIRLAHSSQVSFWLASVCFVKVAQLLNVKDLRDFEAVFRFVLVETFFPFNFFLIPLSCCTKQEAVSNDLCSFRKEICRSSNTLVTMLLPQERIPFR